MTLPVELVAEADSGAQRRRAELMVGTVASQDLGPFAESSKRR